MSVLTECAELRGAAAAFARLTAQLDRIACWGCVSLFVLILVTMIMQVTSRYVLNAPLIWTEEMARMSYIWACYLGAPIAFRRGTHVAITFVSDRLPRRALAAVNLLLQAAALIFLTQLAIQGMMLTIRSHHLDMITLPFSWSAVYIAAPISAILMILESVRALWLGPIPSSPEVVS